MLRPDQMTMVSRADFNAVDRLRQNSFFARQFLESGIHPRSFPETMMKYAEVDDPVLLRLKLFSLAYYKGESSGDSLRKKVDGWLKGRSVPSSRDQLIRICFALDMNVENAQNFMSIVSEGSLHYRNPVELTWLFGLQHHLTYNDTAALQQKVSTIRVGGAGSTRDIISKFQKVQTMDEFMIFVSSNAESLGKLHNAAYMHFTRFMHLLTDPESCNGITEDIYSIRDVVRMYLDIPEVANRERSTLSRVLARHWPDEILLSRIANRQVDVPRKVLTLLFLITDGGKDVDIISDDPAELFADRYRRLNTLLDECSYSQLDPRNTFDWLALYCMYLDDEADVSERMRDVFRENIEK